MKITNEVKIDVKNSREDSDGTIMFAQPLAITDNSLQWNNTRYDIDTLDITTWDGVITADHGQKLSDVIGKAINLRKDNNRVLIDGIKYAVKENPVAVLAKNLMKGGFCTGVSIETMGGDPDDNMVWKNHKLCGMSQVVHPNNLSAYAVVNAINEARRNGLDTTEIETYQPSLNDRLDAIIKNLS